MSLKKPEESIKKAELEKPQIVKLSNNLLTEANCLVGKGGGCTWK